MVYQVGDSHSRWPPGGHPESPEVVEPTCTARCLLCCAHLRQLDDLDAQISWIGRVVSTSLRSANVAGNAWSNGGFYGNIMYKWWIFPCHVWLPEVNWLISLEFVKLNRFFLQCGILWAFMDFYPLAHGPKGVTVTGALCAKIQLEETGLWTGRPSACLIGALSLCKWWQLIYTLCMFSFIFFPKGHGSRIVPIFPKVRKNRKRYRHVRKVDWRSDRLPDFWEVTNGCSSTQLQYTHHRSLSLSQYDWCLKIGHPKIARLIIISSIWKDT